MKAIGGYPELELRNGDHYHKDAIRLNTARNCLEYILLAREYRKVYVPLYTCEAVLEPFTKHALWNIKTEFYQINEKLEPVRLPDLKDEEAFLYTNYFGLKQETVDKLAKLYGDRLIVDNSQAFFDQPHTGIDTFYSARKFFGVPDGAYLYTDTLLYNYNGSKIETDHSFDRMSALLKRIDIGAEAGYGDFQTIEDLLSHQPIKRMSKLTEKILKSIDYDTIRETRCRNYDTLYWRLFQHQNYWVKRSGNAVPLCYPFLAKNSSIRKELIDNRIFVPTYWPNVLEHCEESTIEYKYASLILPLPIDQRYDKQDMETMASFLLKYNKEN